MSSLSASKLADHANNTVHQFILDESGATAIEYGLIASLLSVAIVGGATSLGSSVESVFSLINNEFGQGVGVPPSPAQPNSV